MNLKKIAVAGIKIYGDVNFRDKDCRIEIDEQKEFFGDLKEWHRDFYEIAIHPKNEGKRSRRAATFDQSMGSLNTGASDIIIPARFAFVCEMKRADHTCSSITTDQLRYLRAAKELGAFTCIALGNKGARLALND